jgi:hypothetical protein
VVELKALSGSIQHAHVSQCRQYMRALRISHGIVVNFVQHQQGAKDVEIFDCRLGKPFYPASVASLPESGKKLNQKVLADAFFNR